MFTYISLIVIVTSLSEVDSTIKRPHIIFFLADDLGWNDVSFHGSLQIPTPNIDVLASNGIVLNNYYVQHMCTPSRAALLTGRHPIHLGLQHWVLSAPQNAGLPLHVKLLPEHLRKLGYATHAIGKWHLGFHKKEYTPTYRGFDSFLGTWLPCIDYYDHTYFSNNDNMPQKFVWGRALRDNMEPTNKYLGKYATHVFTDKALDIINNHNVSQPLFLYVAHVAVHSGNEYRLFQSPMKEMLRMKHIKDYDRQIFAGMVEALDESVGRVFEALEKKGMLEDVIFVFSSDNGGEAVVVGAEKAKGSNWPLRGNKATFWEGGIRGTAFVWSRLLKKQKRISNQLMHISDWFTTLYHAAGGNVDDLGDVYGLDLWDSLSYNLPSRREEILHNIDPLDKASALRTGKYKIMVGSNLGGKYNGWYGPYTKDNEINYSVYTKRLQKCDAWKVLERRGWLDVMTEKWRSQLDIQCTLNDNRYESTTCEPNLEPCLFDIEEDPCERRNLAYQYPEIVKAMLDRLQEYNVTAVPLLNLTSDPRADPLLHSFLWTNWAQEL